MFQSRRTRVCAFLVLTMTVFALPKLLLAHPGHGSLSGLVADALFLSSGGCDNSATTETE